MARSRSANHHLRWVRLLVILLLVTAVIASASSGTLSENSRLEKSRTRRISSGFSGVNYGIAPGLR